MRFIYTFDVAPEEKKRKEKKRKRSEL